MLVFLCFIGEGEFPVEGEQTGTREYHMVAYGRWWSVSLEFNVSVSFQV